MKKRVVVVGFGDTGMLVAINLGNNVDIIGISPKPCLVSGQELGLRLTQTDSWKRDYLVPFRRYKKLDHVTIHQGLVSAINTDKHQESQTAFGAKVILKTLQQLTKISS